MENGRVREYFRLVSVLCVGILFLSGFSITTNAWAYDDCDYFYEALIDVDNNPSTGGTALVVQGSETPHSGVHGLTVWPFGSQGVKEVSDGNHLTHDMLVNPYK